MWFRWASESSPVSPWVERLSPQAWLKVSAGVALVTIGLKTAAWGLTDSVGLLSDALESVVNLAGAMFGLLMVTVAARPADEDHPFGHHKAEYFSSGFEGLLIVAAAVGIIWAAAHRLWSPEPVVQLEWGLALSVVSSALNGLLAWYLLAASRHHRSVALEGDAKHLMTDVWTSVGVVGGLMAAQWTGWWWLDSAVAIGVALNILREGVALVWAASQGLMDQAVEPDVQAHLQRVLQGFEREWAGEGIHFDSVRTRKAGSHRHLAAHLHLPADWTLGQAADLRVQVGRALVQAVPDLSVTLELLPQETASTFEASRGTP